MQHKHLVISQAHIALIHEAKKISEETLQMRIHTLPRLEFDAKIPIDEKTQKTLFHIILEDNRLEEDLKCKLLEHLFHFIGYSPFYSLLIKGPLAEKFLKKIEFNGFLTHIYTEYLINQVDDNFEHQIWQSILICPDKGPLLLKELLNHLANHSRILQYIEYWMDSVCDKNKIPYVYEIISRLLDVRLKPYLPLIKKMANCRILTIEYHEEEKCSHHPQTPKVENKIKHFLQMNEPYLFKSLMIHPSAEVIYEAIQKDRVSHGKQQYLDKISRIEHEVIEQLAEDHYEGEFKMSV